MELIAKMVGKLDVVLRIIIHFLMALSSDACLEFTETSTVTLDL